MNIYVRRNACVCVLGLGWVVIGDFTKMKSGERGEVRVLPFSFSLNLKKEKGRDKQSTEKKNRTEKNQNIRRA